MYKYLQKAKFQETYRRAERFQREFWKLFCSHLKWKYNTFPCSPQQNSWQAASEPEGWKAAYSVKPQQTVSEKIQAACQLQESLYQNFSAPFS